MTTKEFNRIFAKLAGAYPGNHIADENHEAFKAVFGEKTAEHFEKSVDYFIRQDRQFLPSTGQVLSVYRRVAQSAIESKYQDSKGRDFPAMTDEEAEAEAERMIGFMEAYPFRHYPKSASDSQCKAHEDQYFEIMRRHGLEPDEDTHPKVNRFLMAHFNLKIGETG